MKRSALILICCLALLLAACRGGGDPDPTATLSGQSVSGEATQEAINPATLAAINEITQAPTLDNSGPPTETPIGFEPEEFYNELGTPIPPDQVTPFATFAVATLDPAIPPAGVLATSTTAEPDDAGSGFDSLIFTQFGGPADTTLTIQINVDGTVTRDDQQLQASPVEIEDIATRIDEVNFFGLQNAFVSTTPLDDDDYRYQLVVVRGESSRSITAQDGLTPEPLLALFAAIRAAADT